MDEFVKTLTKAKLQHHLNKIEIIELLSTQDAEKIALLFQAADEVRQEYVGTDVHLRGLVEFSNHCSCHCMYCGIRRGNKALERYRMEPDEIIATAKQAFELGYRTIVLQSGEDDYYTCDIMCEIIKGIKREADVAVTLSIGERTYDEYRRMKENGADRYLMRFETSNETLYQKLHPLADFKNRIKCLKDIKALGYELGSGFLIGLPGQTVEDLADDILLLVKLDVDMAGIGPFISHPNTPLKGCQNGDLETVLKVLAVVRLLMPYINIPATTAVGTADPMGRQKALQAGANVIMPNVTPLKYRQLYQLYPGKICIGERPEDCRPCVERLIRSVGRTVGMGYGQSKNWKRG